MKDFLKVLLALIPVAKVLAKQLKEMKDDKEKQKILDSIDPVELTVLICGL